MDHTLFRLKTFQMTSVPTQKKCHLIIHWSCFLSFLLKVSHCIEKHERFTVPERGRINEEFGFIAHC